jgi:hypothetical protein
MSLAHFNEAACLNHQLPFHNLRWMKNFSFQGLASRPTSDQPALTNAGLTFFLGIKTPIHFATSPSKAQ